MRKRSLWLAGVILLTIIAFLYVFQPITFSPRKDPADAERHLRPIGTPIADFKSDALEQKPTLLLGGKKPVYVYRPTHDISLGLDLRGGMRVVLEIASRGEFNYKLNRTINSVDERGAKQLALFDAVTAELAEGTSIQIEVAKDGAVITTDAKSLEAAKDQLKQLNIAMTTIFGEGSFKAPNAEEAFKPVTATNQADVINVMEKRIDPNGVKEIVAYPKGTNQIVIEIPGEKDPDLVRERLGRTAELNFMLLAYDISIGQNNDGSVFLSRSGAEIDSAEALKSAVLVARGRDLDPKSISVQFDTAPSNSGGQTAGTPELAVSFAMKPEARGEFAAMTGANVGRNMAIVLEGEITSAPVIRARIDGNGQISGGFSEKEARELQNLLKAGSLSVRVNIIETRTISATLGQDSIEKSLIAGFIGFMLVLIFMVAYYRLPGLMASLALIVYFFLVLAVIRFFGSTLTLPGIAGVIISLGMAVDANIIIFERLKEELRAQKPLPTALHTAFNRALTAIIDSNVASIITGLVLYTFGGSGAVQNFAVTLVIGIVVSLFTAITITRLFMELLISSRTGHNLSRYGL